VARIFEGLGPGSLVPQRGKLALNDPRLGPEEGFVLSRIDGRTSLDEVCLLVPFEEQVVMLILRKLWELGAIEVPGVARVVRTHSKPSLPKIDEKEKVLPQPAGNSGELNPEQVRRIDDLFNSLETRNPFELLGVTVEADAKDIKRAYFKLSKEFHPDRFYTLSLGDYDRKLTAIFQAIKNAFELLSDEKRRAAYLESQQ
jgi:hypothetical protein